MSVAAGRTRATGPGFRCACGHELRVYGGGRHQIFFEAGGARPLIPITDHACPACGLALPRRNAR